MTLTLHSLLPDTRSTRASDLAYTEVLFRQAHFEEIKKQIIRSLLEAEFIIWVAVAWFTDKDLDKILREKFNKGINVRVVVNDDEITSKSGLDFNSKERGDLVACVDEAGREIARGLVNYSSLEITRIKRRPSQEIESILGYVNEPEIIHRDDLVLLA